MGDMMDGAIPYALFQGVQAMIAALGNGFTLKGIVASTSDLPESGELGDLYMVSSEGYASYTWDEDENEWVLKIGVKTASVSDIEEALFT